MTARSAAPADGPRAAGAPDAGAPDKGAPDEAVLVLLHTSPVHVPAFDALRDAGHPGVTLRHVVAEELLARARAEGPEAVAAEVGAVLAPAVAEGAGAVLCTCSTIGEVAERAGTALGVPVLRADRPMAEAAAATGRVVVVATVESTLGPTAELIREAAAGQALDLRTVLVEGAWERFEAGDMEGYLERVAAAVDAVTDSAEGGVIVLAQASMAGAAERIRSAVPVLTGPRTGLAAAVAAATAAR